MDKTHASNKLNMKSIFFEFIVENKQTLKGITILSTKYIYAHVFFQHSSPKKVSYLSEWQSYRPCLFNLTYSKMYSLKKVPGLSQLPKRHFLLSTSSFKCYNFHDLSNRNHRWEKVESIHSSIYFNSRIKWKNI
jgi:hypothetical protein